MTYQVLARKWRPKSFADMVGQQHVVRALCNALDRDQLHHAYLFTGTRGVGKTTLARILSKALNCERGVSSTPCGECSACREIDGGRFVDLLEVDAASRTKVDQTRELLDNVPYAPARGRFKVYLIDEVHMFSGHSFNALLKTLEEPPPHVKFLLATTDPQKVPVTVLSRCLQFNLRRLLPEEIRARLQQVLETEGLEHEPAALRLLARAADGSMRDALSLLDQAIAFGGGAVAEAEVRTMLGSVSGDVGFDLAAALVAGDGARLLAEVERISALTPDYGELLKELIGLLHRLALFQQVPETVAPDDPDRERIADLSARLTPEDLQLYYQIALTGQQDLPLTPDPRSGLEMVLLRALAFRPVETGTGQAGSKPGRPETTPSKSGSTPGEPGSAQGTAGTGSGAAGRAVIDPAAPVEDTGAMGGDNPRRPGARPTGAEPRPEQSPPGHTPTPEPTTQGARDEAEPSPSCTADWHRLVDGLGVGGMATQLAHHCVLVECAGERLVLSLDPTAEQLRSPRTEQRLREALEAALGRALRLEIQIAQPDQETPAQRRARELAERQRAAERSLEEDPVALRLREQLDAQWVPGSVEATD